MYDKPTWDTYYFESYTIYVKKILESAEYFHLQMPFYAPSFGCWILLPRKDEWKKHTLVKMISQITTRFKAELMQNNQRSICSVGFNLVVLELRGKERVAVSIAFRRGLKYIFNSKMQV